MIRGRRPLPSRVKEMRGNPGHRPLNDAEPTLPPDMPPCPRHLSREARHEWRRMSRQLHEAGILTKIDRTALAAYCQLYARWVKAEQEVERLGEVVKAPTGYPIQNPYLSVANTALKLMHGYLVEFGMTPSARSRVKAKKPKDQTATRREKFLGIVHGNAQAPRSA